LKPPGETLERSNWLIVGAATFAGVTIALQMGKAAATLPLIRAEFGSGLTLLATYVALISIVAASVGLGFGSITRRLGAGRAGLIGLGLVAVGSALGAMVGTVPMLLATRMIEALGFALTVTAMPAVIQPATKPQDRLIALGIWATWLPAGIALMMAISFFWLTPLGWRGMFWVTAILPAIAALILIAVVPADIRAGGVKLPPIRSVFRRDVLLTTTIFVAFSSSNLIVLAFLPTILVDVFGMAANEAAVISFFGAVALISTNILAGWMLKRGFGRRALYLVGFAGMMGFAAILLGPQFGQTPRVAAAIMFSFCAGVPPAIVWASIPVLARDPSEVPILSGLFFQGAGLGQIIGPMLAGWMVDTSGGWSMSFWVIAGLISCGMVLTILLPRPETSGAQS
jgi:cyanate permease